MEKKILDPCSGSRMFYFQKQREDMIYGDNRVLETTLCDGRKLAIKPDVLLDVSKLPYSDCAFKIVVFDPPHLKRAGETSWLRQKYGVLPSNWQSFIKQGFDECMRVLEPYGILIFKWNETQIKLKELLEVFGTQPTLGEKRSKTHWLIFIKNENGGHRT